MDGNWRVMDCPSCRGYGMIWVGDASWDGIAECDCGNGNIYLRPTGHGFQYPGGPANGFWGKEYYEKAKPYMPSCEHGTVFINHAECDQCNEEFKRDFGYYPWEDKEDTSSIMHHRLAQKALRKQIKTTGD